jgi:hypothetical protein
MQHPFAHLLLATEHTEFDAGAERVALALAHRCGLPLAAVLPIVSNPEYEAAAPQLAAQADAEAGRSMASLRSVAAAAGVAFEIRARRGEEPWREIVAEARERGADLLIARRRGKRGFLANLLVGEMVGKVAGQAPCSTLLVPRAAAMWQRRVLAAIDASAAAPVVAATAAAIAAECGLPLALVSVAQSESQRAPAARALQSLASALPAGDVAVADEVLTGRPHEQILAAAERLGADLIVLGRRGETNLDRPLMGSVAQKVIGLANGPVLVVRT